MSGMRATQPIVARERVASRPPQRETEAALDEERDEREGGPLTGSPFRFAASALFHAAITRGTSSTGGPFPLSLLQPMLQVRPRMPRTAGLLSISTDVLCHASPQQRREESSSTVSLSPRVGVTSATGADRQRKRPRLPDPVEVSEAAAAAAERTWQGERAAPRRQHPPATEVTGASSSSPLLEVSLSSRVMENESLLDDLLGRDTSTSATTAAAAAMQGTTETATTQRIPGERQPPLPEGEGAHRTPREDGESRAKAGALAALGSLSAKELRARCLAAGLLGCGTKAELRQRLERFENGEGSKLPPAAIGATPRLPSPPRSSAPAAVGASLLHPPQRREVSSSPPRTIFRYCSSSRSSSPGAEPLRRGGGAGEAHRAPGQAPPLQEQQDHRHDQSRRRWQAQQERQRRQRTVPSPTAFLEQFVAMAKDRQSRRVPAARAGRLRGHVDDEGAESVERALQTREAGAVGAWQLLVDHRERLQGSHEKMMDMLQKTSAPCVSTVLPCGDFMIAVHRSVPPTREETRSSAEAREGDDDVGDNWDRLLPSLLPVVVERKTVTDLDSSIKGSRYVEQRRLLQRAPFAQVVWLIEGSAATAGGGPPSQSAATRANRQHHVRPAGGRYDRSTALADAHVRVNSACASLSVQPGFTVVRTRTAQESAAFLHQLARAMAARHSFPPRQHHRHHDTLNSRGLSLHPVSSAWRHQPRASVPALLPTWETLHRTRQLQKHLRAATAMPRMLMRIRGCSAGLALFLVRKYGSLYNLWRVLQDGGGPEAAVDADPEIRSLSLAQRKVVVLLSEFIAATEYF